MFFSITFLLCCSIRGYHSQVDIIVCTPGRLVDHINKTPGFDLTHLRFLVSSVNKSSCGMIQIMHDILLISTTLFFCPNESFHIHTY